MKPLDRLRQSIMRLDPFFCSKKRKSRERERERESHLEREERARTRCLAVSQSTKSIKSSSDELFALAKTDQWPRTVTVQWQWEQLKILCRGAKDDQEVGDVARWRLHCNCLAKEIDGDSLNNELMVHPDQVRRWSGSNGLWRQGKSEKSPKSNSCLATWLKLSVHKNRIKRASGTLLLVKVSIVIASKL